jgi:uncharacterized protein (DUF1015 family)
VHTLGALDDTAVIREIEHIVERSPLVLADGHHRFETACNYRDELRAAGQDVGGAGAIMTFVVELVDDELSIEAIHRVIDLPPATDLRAALADAFTVRELGPNTPDGIEDLERRMHDTHALGMIDSVGLALAIPHDDARAAVHAGEHPAVATTDAALVEALVAPRLPGAVWHYRHDAHAIGALVDKGAATAAILCNPVSVAQTRAAAVDRVRMPHTTTFFSPKPRTGMVFRTLD